MKPLDLNEDYSHVIPSSGYTPKVSFRSENGGDKSGNNEDDSAVETGDENNQENNDNEKQNESDDVSIYMKMPATPSKRRPIKKPLRNAI